MKIKSETPMAPKWTFKIINVYKIKTFKIKSVHHKHESAKGQIIIFISDEILFIYFGFGPERGVKW
jgi:hypothetical protein